MKPIILIRNNSDYYTEKPVLDWVEENKIEVFPPLLHNELAKKEKKKEKKRSIGR
jgi:hypothetical protein